MSLPCHENSIDKSKLLKPNEFGYNSIHLVVSLNDDRHNLPEWNTYQSIKAEIQIRTILQHAWASMSRELDYTHEEEIPSELRRRLFRLSGLLELADEEFLSISKQKSDLQEEVAEKIEQGDIDLELNSTTLKEYLLKSELVQEYLKIALDLGFRDVYNEPEYHNFEEDFQSIIKICIDNKVDSIKKLDHLLSDFKSNVKKRLHAQFNISENNWIVSRGFIVQMLLIIIYYEYINSSYLVNLGWDKDIATRVLKTAKESS